MTNDLSPGISPATPPEKKHPAPGEPSGPSPMSEGLGHPAPDEQDEDTPWHRSQHGASRRMLPGPPPGPWKKILFFLALALFLYTLVGFFLAPYLLTAPLPDLLSKKLQRPVTIGSARVNPYTLKITLKNGIIGPEQGNAADKVDPVLSFGRLEGRLNPFFFLNKGPLVTSISGTSVFAHLVRHQDGHLNIATLVGRLTTSPAPPQLARLAQAIQGGGLQLTNSRLIFTDQASGSQHTLEEIHLSFPRRDSKATSVSPQFSALIDGSPVSVGGHSESSAAGHTTRLTFTLEKINLADYLIYLPAPLPGLITKGEADLELLIDHLIAPDNSSQFEISGSGVARDIWLHTAEKGENKIAAAHFAIRFDPIRSQLTINKLILDQPDLQLQRQKDGSYIFPGLGDGPTPAPDSTITLTSLVVKNGRLSYVDQKVKGGFGAIFNDINLTIEQPAPGETDHSYALNSVTSRMTRLASQGRVSLERGSIDGLLILHNLPVAALNSHLPEEQGLTLGNGIIDKAEATLQLLFADRRHSSFRLSNIKGSATNLDILYQGKEWLHIDQGLFTDMAISTSPATSSLGHISLAGLLGRLSPQDTPLLTDLFSPAPKTGLPPLTGLEIKSGTLLLRDFAFQATPELPVTIVSLTASGFGGNGQGTGTIAAHLALPDKGQCQLSGELSVTPRAGALEITMKNVPLNIFRATVLDRLAPEIHGGSLDCNGTFSLADLSYRGPASLRNLRARTKSSHKRLLTLKKAAAPQVHLRLDPFDLQLDSLDLDTLDIFTTLTPDVDSIAALFFNPKPPGERAPVGLTAAKIGLRNSSLTFTDTTLTPPFTTRLGNIHGTISNLSTIAGKTARLEISAETEDQATLRASGQLRPLAQGHDLDLNVLLTGQPLTPLLPYLETMAGHGLTGGVFDLAVAYKKSAGKVAADTVLTVQRLGLAKNDLGNKQFPVTVALVTDNDQRITLELPITADLTDPSYTFQRAYGKKLRSLISRATVSPFSLLTDFYDAGGPAPDHVLFEVGSTRPRPDSLPHLRALRDILNARPLLHITIRGFSAGTEDRDALLQKKRDEEEKKRLALQNALSSDVIVSYGKEVIETPPALPFQGESTGLLTVSKEELLTLARERCLHLKEILVSEYGIAAHRILISPDSTVVPASGAGLAGNRADFILGRLEQPAQAP